MPVPDVGEFRVGRADNDGQVVLRLVGDLDAGTVPCMRQVLDDLRGRPVARLVFEMEDLTFIDSSGLHELVVALKRQREGGGDVVLRRPTAQTMRVLEIVGLSDVFVIA